MMNKMVVANLVHRPIRSLISHCEAPVYNGSSINLKMDK